MSITSNEEKVILQPVVAGRSSGSLTESNIKPPVELPKGDFLKVADHGKAMNVNGRNTTVYCFNRGRYIVK